MGQLLKLFFILLFPFIAFSQSDSLDLLRNKKWTPEGRNWFGDSIVVLAPVKLGIDTTGFTDEKKERILLLYPWGEKLWIDSTGEFQHSDYMYCPVGETWRDMNSFKLDSGIVTVEYRYVTWEQPRPEFSMMRYQVKKWNESQILLERIEENIPVVKPIKIEQWIHWNRLREEK